MSQVSQFTYISNSAVPLSEDKFSSVRMNLMMSELRYRTAVPIFFRRNGKAPFRSSFLKFARLIPSISAASGWSISFGSTIMKKSRD